MNNIVRLFWLLLAWPFVWLLDIGILLCDGGEWNELRAISRRLWLRAWNRNVTTGSANGLRH